MLGQVHVSGFEISNALCYRFVGRGIEFNIVNKCKIEIRVLVNSIATGDVIQAQVDRNQDGS